MKRYTVPEFNTWGRWELDGDGAEVLREAMKSNLPFEIGYHGFGKLDHSLAVSRGEDLSYTVKAYAEMDSPFDDTALIYDCIEDGEEDLLTDKVIKEIQDTLDIMEFSSEAETTETLDADATMDDIYQLMLGLFEACTWYLDGYFDLCKDVTCSALMRERERR